MISKELNKHSSLAKPSFGYFGRNEWAILGTDCNRIKHLSDLIIAALSPSYKIAYVDAHHNHQDTEPSLPARLANGADIEYTEHISYGHIN
ncbi:MAG TPA: hypothetical protein VFQ58_00570, partial [Flavisolibacter sp.]|nr:hypothetical protein [Flavisolibacter sp.]